MRPPDGVQRGSYEYSPCTLAIRSLLVWERNRA